VVGAGPAGRVGAWGAADVIAMVWAGRAGEAESVMAHVCTPDLKTPAMTGVKKKSAALPRRQTLFPW